MPDNFNLKKNLPFVIAEIGHNHQGSMIIAKEMFLAAKNAGASAVKLQKRSNKDLFTKSFFNKSYDHKNSYAKTYGEHREFLEFGKKEYQELINYAKEIDIIFFSTPFDFKSVDFLSSLEMPAYKIASADLINTPLQKEIAKTGKIIFLSTGGGSLDDVKRAYDTIMPINTNLSILHCTASYPVEAEDMNLNCINTLIEEFPKTIIGLSDHENGIDAASVAYMLGARIFEKHFTLNRAWKGTDQSFSLEPEGLKKLVRNLKRIPKFLGSDTKKLLENEKKPLFKMQKSIVTSRALKKGHVISYDDLAFKSPGSGLKPYQYDLVLNKKILKELKEDDLILLEDLE